MPHVVIEEAPDLGSASRSIEPSVLRDESTILKVVDVIVGLRVTEDE